MIEIIEIKLRLNKVFRKKKEGRGVDEIEKEEKIKRKVREKMEKMDVEMGREELGKKNEVGNISKLSKVG